MNISLCISFGRRKEWNFWFLSTHKEPSDHFRNFGVSAKSVEERLSKYASPLDDFRLLEEIVQELISTHNYFSVTFPAMTLSLTESSKPKTILEEFPAFPVIQKKSKIDSSFLLLYSRNEHWDKFRLDLFAANPELAESIKAISAKQFKNHPRLAPLDKHELILSALGNEGKESLSFDHLEFHGPTRSGEGLSPFWEEWLSPEFLTRNLAVSPRQSEEQGSPF